MQKKATSKPKAKTVEITFAQVLLANDALGRLAKEKNLGALAAYRIAALISEIQLRAAPAYETRLRVYKKYGEETQKGSGLYIIKKPENVLIADKELGPLLKETLTLHCKPILLSLLADKTETITPEDMMQLRPFIEDDLASD